MPTSFRESPIFPYPTHIPICTHSFLLYSPTDTRTISAASDIDLGDYSDYLLLHWRAQAIFSVMRGVTPSFRADGHSYKPGAVKLRWLRVVKICGCTRSTGVLVMRLVGRSDKLQVSLFVHSVVDVVSPGGDAGLMPYEKLGCFLVLHPPTALGVSPEQQSPHRASYGQRNTMS